MLSTTQPSTGTLGVRGHFLVPGSLQGESAWCFSAQQKTPPFISQLERGPVAEAADRGKELELLDNTWEMLS